MDWQHAHKYWWHFSVEAAAVAPESIMRSIDLKVSHSTTEHKTSITSIRHWSDFLLRTARSRLPDFVRHFWRSILAGRYNSTCHGFIYRNTATVVSVMRTRITSQFTWRLTQLGRTTKSLPFISRQNSNAERSSKPEMAQLLACPTPTFGL